MNPIDGDRFSNWILNEKVWRSWDDFCEVKEALESGSFAIKEDAQKCPECLKSSSHSDWNAATRDSFGEDIEEIQTGLGDYFTCPQCRETVDRGYFEEDTP